MKRLILVLPLLLSGCMTVRQCNKNMDAQHEDYQIAVNNLSASWTEAYCNDVIYLQVQMWKKDHKSKINIPPLCNDYLRKMQEESKVK